MTNCNLTTKQKPVQKYGKENHVDFSIHELAVKKSSGLATSLMGPTLRSFSLETKLLGVLEFEWDAARENLPYIGNQYP